MSKYHSKKMGYSHYPERLEARGVSSAQVRMPFIDGRGRKYQSMEALFKAQRGEN
jgi:hypothetical protein